MPTHLRSRAFAFSFFVQFLSVPAVALMSWWLVPQPLLSLEGWRWVVIVGALAGATGPPSGGASRAERDGKTLRRRARRGFPAG
nr:MFS transporter [Candidatus Pantoea persica]